MIEPTPAMTQKPLIFISYSRADMNFADRLVEALNVRGFDCYIDRTDLWQGENWRETIIAGCRAADTAVFIVSPRSVASDVCTWELLEFEKMNKRLATAVVERVERDRIPQNIYRIDQIYFDTPDDFQIRIDELASALLDRIDWWQNHRRFSGLAYRWSSRGRPQAILLKAHDIILARSWADQCPQNAQIPELTIEFIEAGSLALPATPPTLFQRLARSFKKKTHSLPETFLAGHSSGVHFASFSPDGDHIVTGSRQTVHLWEARSGKELTRLAHNGAVRSAQFSDDGAWLLTSSADGNVRLWDAVNGIELTRFIHDSEVNSAVFDKDALSFVAISGYTAKIWNLANGQVRACLEHGNWVRSAFFSPNAAKVVTASEDRTARLWDASVGTEVIRLMHSSSVRRADFADDGTKVITRSGSVGSIWNANDGIEITRIKHEGRIWTAAFAPDSCRVITASEDRTARVWDAKNGFELSRFVHDGAVSSATVISDGTRLLTISGGTARIWNLASGAELWRYEHDGQVRSAALSPDGTRLLTASADTKARIWALR